MKVAVLVGHTSTSSQTGWHAEPYTLKRLLLVSLLFPLTPVGAQEPDIQCPGMNTIEMRWCASKSLEESDQSLRQQLPPETFENWRRATREVCAVAYAPYLQGTIYPQMVVGCDDRLNRVLLEELQDLSK